MYQLVLPQTIPPASSQLSTASPRISQLRRPPQSAHMTFIGGASLVVGSSIGCPFGSMLWELDTAFPRFPPCVSFSPACWTMRAPVVTVSLPHDPLLQIHHRRRRQQDAAARQTGSDFQGPG